MGDGRTSSLEFGLGDTNAYCPPDIVVLQNQFLLALQCDTGETLKKCRSEIINNATSCDKFNFSSREGARPIPRPIFT